MSITLEVVSGVGAGRRFTLPAHDIFIVGRSGRCHFSVGGDLDCSRMHVMLEAAPPHLRVLDLGSMNGTFLNGKRVQQADVRDGDVLSLGDTQLRVHVAPVDAPRPGRSPAAGIPAPMPPASTTTDYRSDDPALRIPGYRLDHRLQQGGMASVWRGSRLSDGQAVAIKILHPHIESDSRQRQRFVREARLLESLSHPRIVRQLEAGEAHGELFLVMEYVPGRDAARLCGELGRPLKLAEALPIIRQTLEGLAHAHAQGVVHRDIKPSNLLLTGTPPNCRVKVADFGSSKSLRATGLSSLTQVGYWLGTLNFMPPEQLLDCAGVDHRADLFGIAATLYWLLTRQYVYDVSIKASRVLQSVMEGRVVPIAKHGIRSPTVQAFLERALDRDPGRRFESATEMAEALPHLTVA